MDTPLPEVRRLAIVGTGLLGASVALGLKAAGFTGTVVGHGRRRETVERAVGRGAIDVIADDLTAVGDCDLLLICVPLSAFAAVFDQLAPHVGDRQIITDVGSTKTQVVEEAARRLPGRRFVGSHPMAGSEQQGPDAAT